MTDLSKIEWKSTGFECQPREGLTIQVSPIDMASKPPGSGGPAARFEIVTPALRLVGYADDMEHAKYRAAATIPYLEALDKLGVLGIWPTPP